MKHVVKEAIAASTALFLTCVITYPSIIYLLFMWDQDKEDLPFFYGILAADIIILVTVYSMFQWVRRK